MSTRVETEDIEPTRSEKLLAVVLVVFLLIGTTWTYAKVADWVGANPSTVYSAAEERALDRAEQADNASFEAVENRDEAREEVELARDRVSLAVEQGRRTQRLEAELERAEQTYAAARKEVESTAAAAKQAREKADAAESSYTERTEGKNARYWWAAAVRLALVLLLLGASLRLVTVQRARASRYLTVGLSTVAAATLTATWFAIDYVIDYIDVVELGPIVLSIAGVAATLVAFIALQRYLARRVPRSRVRKGECPFCGFPVRGDGPHCEGCGRDVVATCTTCSTTRRVGSPHCATCGAD